MPTYRIHRLKDHLRPTFRYAPHTTGRTSVKPRDYEQDNTVDAITPYAAFFALRATGTPLEVGDLLETPEGALSIFKFVGFEEAEWLIPAPKSEEAPVVESPVSLS